MTGAIAKPKILKSDTVHRHHIGEYFFGYTIQVFQICTKIFLQDKMSVESEKF